MIPGPNVALIVANTLRYGLRMGCVTVFGTTLGVAIQPIAVVLGLAAIIDIAAEALIWIRWIGVAYLVYLGIRTWNEPAGNLLPVTAAPTVFWRGCMIAAINPKTLLFNAAFLPQFVVENSNVNQQLTVVASVFLGVLLLGDLVWALGATAAQRFLHRFAAAKNRISGGFLVAAGVGLAFSRRSM